MGKFANVYMLMKCNACSALKKIKNNNSLIIWRCYRIKKKNNKVYIALYYFMYTYVRIIYIKPNINIIQWNEGVIKTKVHTCHNVITRVRFLLSPNFIGIHWLRYEVVQKHKNPNSSYNYIIIKNTHRISRSGACVIEDRRHLL